MNFKNLDKAIISMKYNNKAKWKNPGRKDKVIGENNTWTGKIQERNRRKKKSFRNEDSLERAQRRIDVEKIQ